MPNSVSSRDFNTSPEIIQLAVMLYVRFTLSLRYVEDFLHERGVDVRYESVRYWWHEFGSLFGRQIKKRRAGGMHSSNRMWHLDDVFGKINFGIDCHIAAPVGAMLQRHKVMRVEP